MRRHIATLTEWALVLVLAVVIIAAVRAFHDPSAASCVTDEFVAWLRNCGG